MMFIGIYKPYDSEYEGAIYSGEYAWDAWHEDTFSVECEYIIPMWLSGKTYWERKNALEEIAKEWLNTFSEGVSWSMGECMVVQNFLEKNAKRYGLIREFRENCVI